MSSSFKSVASSTVTFVAPDEPSANRPSSAIPVNTGSRRVTIEVFEQRNRMGLLPDRSFATDGAVGPDDLCVGAL